MPVQRLSADGAAFHKDQIVNPTPLAAWEYRTNDKSARTIPTSWPKDYDNQADVREAITCLEQPEDVLYVHQLLLHIDETRDNRGHGAKANAALGPEFGIKWRNTDPSKYDVSKPEDSIFLWLEARPRSARAYKALNYIFQASKSIQMNEENKIKAFNDPTDSPYIELADQANCSALAWFNLWNVNGTMPDDSTTWNAKQLMRFQCCKILSKERGDYFRNKKYWVNKSVTPAHWMAGQTGESPNQIDLTAYRAHILTLTKFLAERTIDRLTWAGLIGVHGPVFPHAEDLTAVIQMARNEVANVPASRDHAQAALDLLLSPDFVQGTISAYWNVAELASGVSWWDLIPAQRAGFEHAYRYLATVGEVRYMSSRSNGDLTGDHALRVVSDSPAETAMYLKYLPEWQRNAKLTPQGDDITATYVLQRMSAGYKLHNNFADLAPVKLLGHNAVADFAAGGPNTKEWVVCCVTHATRTRLLTKDGINCAYQRPTTHREPLDNPWGQVRHVYGKKGLLAEDGTFQHGHWMQLGPKAGQDNALTNRQSTFWLANTAAPQGTRSAWIPQSDGNIREVWFSTAASEVEEEKAAQAAGRVPYRLYASVPADQFVTDVTHPGQTRRVPPQNYIVPALTVFNAKTGTEDVSIPYDQVRGYYPTIPDEAPMTQPSFAADEESGDYSAYSAYSEVYSGYSSAYSVEYSDAGYSAYSSDYSY